MAASGRCSDRLATGIEGPRLFKHEALPVGPRWKDVQRLIASTETDRPQDIRDRAILLLLAVYGLRCGEVVAMAVDDTRGLTRCANAGCGTGHLELVVMFGVSGKPCRCATIAHTWCRGADGQTT